MGSFPVLLTQDVAHILRYCNYPDTKGKRETFLAKYENYVNTFAVISFKSSSDKLREMLNLGPSCDVMRILRRQTQFVHLSAMCITFLTLD